MYLIHKTSGLNKDIFKDIAGEMSAEGNLKVLDSIEMPADVMCCRFNTDGGLLAVGLSNGIIKVFASESGSCVYCLSDTETLKDHLPTTCIRWKPATSDTGNQLVATYASGKVKHWHVSSQTCLHTSLENNRQALAMAYSPSGDRFITSGSDTKICVYDEGSKKLLYVLEPSTSHLTMDGHMMRIFSVVFNPHDNNVFLSGGWDDTVQWWDTRVDKKHSVRKIFGPHICGDALDIHPESLNIVTGSWRKDSTLQIWDYNTSKLLKDIPTDFNNRSMLYCAQWEGSNHVLAGGSDGNMLKLVNHGTMQTVGRIVDLPGGVYTADHDRQGTNPVIALGSSTSVYLVQKP